MPFSTMDPLDPGQNPFIVDKSKLVKAANDLSKAQQSAPIRPTNTLTVRATLAQSPTAATSGAAKGPHFEISTQQIINLINRFKLRSMTFEQLKNLPMSQLNAQEREFVTYLRKNPDIFDNIAKLDNQPGISVDDVKIASQLAGDSLVLSDEDLQYLQEVAQHRNDMSVLDARRAESNKADLKTHDLVNTVQQIRPNGLTFAELMNLREDELALEERELQSLRFLRSPTVSKVLEKLVTPYNNMVTPEVLRVLTSLLWNPAIYGATPIVFFQTAPLAQETDIDPVANLGGGSGVRINRNKRIRKSRVEHPRQVVHLEAHHIMDICHRLSPDGNITLAQLRQYEPQNEAEEKALNLLRQTHIFQALAGLEHEPDYLNDNDIKLALAEGALVLSDPFIVLVILP